MFVHSLIVYTYSFLKAATYLLIFLGTDMMSSGWSCIVSHIVLIQESSMYKAGLDAAFLLLNIVRKYSEKSRPCDVLVL